MIGEKEQQLSKPEKAEPSTEHTPIELPQKSSEQRRAECLAELDTELERLGEVLQSPEEFQQISDEKEAGFRDKVAELEKGLGIVLSDESRGMIHKRMVAEPIASFRQKAEQVGRLQEEKENLKKMERIQGILSPEDYKTFVEIIGNEAGSVERIFDPANTFLHTANNAVFDKMLESGVILTEGESQKTPGASFTDGNFPEAISFQLIYDNIAGGGKEKALNSESYPEQLGGTLAESFVQYFWENHPEKAKQYLFELAKKIPAEELAILGLSEGQEVSSFEDALKIGTFFTPRPKEGFGVTIVYDSKKKDELGIGDSKTTGLQKFFEKRSLLKGGVPISEASTILVSRSRIGEIRSKLKEHGIAGVEVRASEEMDARRIIEKVS